MRKRYQAWKWNGTCKRGPKCLISRHLPTGGRAVAARRIFNRANGLADRAGTRPKGAARGCTVRREICAATEDSAQMCERRHAHGFDRYTRKGVGQNEIKTDAPRTRAVRVCQRSGHARPRTRSRSPEQALRERVPAPFHHEAAAAPHAERHHGRAVEAPARRFPEGAQGGKAAGGGFRARGRRGAGCGTGSRADSRPAFECTQVVGTEERRLHNPLANARRL